MVIAGTLVQALVVGALAAAVLTWGGGWAAFVRAWAALALVAFVGLAGPIVVG